MFRTLFFFLLSTAVCLSCNDDNSSKADPNTTALDAAQKAATPGIMHFEGAFSNGMKGDSISFDISADGKTLTNLTFKGYWRCNGRLESTITGPEGSFNIIDNKVNDHIAEPPGGGSTAWRYDLQADINGNSAKGSFRMNINNLGCDSYKLIWTAIRK